MAELLRRLVRSYLQDRQVSAHLPPEAYLKIVALGTSGRADVSDRHDDYIADALGREHSR
jgi:hypothetical protein